MDNDRLIDFMRKRKLPLKPEFLYLMFRLVPVIVKTDFAYGNNLFITTLFLQPFEIFFIQFCRLAWVHACCRVNKVIFFCQPDASLGTIDTGTDIDNRPYSAMKFWFQRQLALAHKINKPVIIHSRDAAKDTFDILAANNAGAVGGVIHCFSYGVDLALRYVEMGLYIGVGGVVTFKNGRKMKEVVEAVPIEKILLETDSPYLAPEPNRGKRNTSLNIPFIAQKIAEIKGLDYDEVVHITEENARRMYRI